MTNKIKRKHLNYSHKLMQNKTDIDQKCV